MRLPNLKYFRKCILVQFASHKIFIKQIKTIIEQLKVKTIEKMWQFILIFDILTLPTCVCIHGHNLYRSVLGNYADMNGDHYTDRKTKQCILFCAMSFERTLAYNKTIDKKLTWDDDQSSQNTTCVCMCGHMSFFVHHPWDNRYYNFS